MSDELIVRHCSPTLAGLKTGNMLMVKFETSQQLNTDISLINRRLGGRGLRMIPLHMDESICRALIYLYRPDKLAKDLADENTRKILEEAGYPYTSPARCVRTLVKRFSEHNDFPHEIGLFLGYPPVDVMGFIQNEARNCKCVGFWKVYGDPKEAQKTFCKYRKCTRLFCKQIASGRPMEQLTVVA